MRGRRATVFAAGINSELAHRVSSLRCASAVAIGGRADRGGSQRPPRRQPGPVRVCRPAEVIRTRYQMKRTPVALKMIYEIYSNARHLSRWRYERSVAP